jgi:hypothetical protein
MTKTAVSLTQNVTAAGGAAKLAAPYEGAGIN